MASTQATSLAAQNEVASRKLGHHATHTHCGMLPRIPLTSNHCLVAQAAREMWVIQYPCDPIRKRCCITLGYQVAVHIIGDQ
jgi:hypothetical protein